MQNGISLNKDQMNNIKSITESMSKKSYGDATEITVDKKDDPRGIKYSLGGDIDGKTDMVEQRPDGSFKIKNISSKTADYLRSKAVEKD
jgi:hypothetical protein